MSNITSFLNGAALTPVSNVSPLPVTLVGAGGGGGAEAITSVDLGAQADAKATSDTGTFSLIALVKRLLSYLSGGVAVTAIGGASIATNQVSVASTATLIVAARTGVPGTGRIDATISNWGTVDVFLGGSGVTTANGKKLPGVPGASITLNSQAAIYGIVSTGTQTVDYIEDF